jgi:8-oxo-dGTP pyrophosphatase MutT (NUDIX family)
LRHSANYDVIAETEEWHELVQQRHAETLSEMPVPYCCPTLAGARAIYPYGPKYDYSDHPVWAINYSTPGFGAVPIEAHACPFCGTRLPKLVLKKTPPPQVCRSDGNYCQNCRERLDGCLCSHPYSVYEAENALPHFAVAALIRRPYKKGFQFLSVSRKTDPTDKGMPGGKIDPEETPAVALVRELLEETGLKALEFHPVFDAQDTTAKRCVTYHVTRFEGELATSETGEVEWVPKEELVRAGSTFEAYNRALFCLIDPYNRYG